MQIKFEIRSVAVEEQLEGAAAMADWRDFYWYHQVDLGSGALTGGDFDMRPYLPCYRFPEDLRGKRVLDVGRASGFFSFEFEARGADVVATEIASFLDWDFVGGEAERERRGKEIGDIEAFTTKHITGAFFFAHAARRSRVSAVTANIYDVATLFGATPFDLVFCGSITSHLRDPLRGLANLRAATADDGVCVIASPYIDDDKASMLLVTGDPDRRSWWVVSGSCLIEMLRAVGFSRAEIVSSFDLVLPRIGQTFPHVIAHARP